MSRTYGHVGVQNGHRDRQGHGVLQHTVHPWWACTDLDIAVWTALNNPAMVQAHADFGIADWITLYNPAAMNSECYMMTITWDSTHPLWACTDLYLYMYIYLGIVDWTTPFNPAEMDHAGGGEYTKGELVIKDVEGAHQVTDIRNKWTLINGSLTHWSQPFGGSRISLVIFTHRAPVKTRAMARKGLADLGFRLSPTARLLDPLANRTPRMRLPQKTCTAA